MVNLMREGCWKCEVYLRSENFEELGSLNRIQSKEDLTEHARNRRGGRPSLGTDYKKMANLRREFAEAEQIKEEADEEDSYKAESDYSITSSSSEEEDMFDEQHIKEAFPGFHKVNVIEPGGSFGEIALRMHVTRQATILCEVATEVAVLSKENYQSILRQYQEELQANKIKFIKQFSIFNCFQELSKDLDTTTYYFEPMEFKYSQNIYKEKDPVEYFYLLREGQVEISKMVSLVQDPKRSRWLSSEDWGDKADQQSGFYAMNTVWKRKKNKETMKRVFEIIRAPCFFGEAEILQKRPIRKQRAVAKSIGVQVLVIKKERLETDFINRYPKFKKALINEFSKKAVVSNEAKRTHVKLENLSKLIRYHWEKEFGSNRKERRNE
jgi:CRP-like cAMP-binding protein